MISEKFPKIKIEQKKEEEKEQEVIQKGFEWTTIDTRDPSIKIKGMEFPSGEKMSFSTFQSKLYCHLIGETPLTEIPTADGLIDLIGCPEHTYQSPIFLELMHREYPDKFQEGLKALELKIKRETILDHLMKIHPLSEKFPGEERGVFCDEKGWWYDKLALSQKELIDIQEHYGSIKAYDRRPEDYYSPEVIDTATGIFIKYAPPVGTKRHTGGREPKEVWSVKDYLRTPALQKKYKQYIPHVGELWKKTREEAIKDPVSALKFVLSTLPAYNAGKEGYAIGGVIEKIKKLVSKKELCEIVLKNKTVGTYDTDVFIKTIKEAYKIKE